MKRLLSGAETAQPPTRPAQGHPHQRDEPRQLEPQRSRASPTIGSTLAEDLELPFQRGEADLVGKIGNDHQPSAQAAGFAVRSTGSQHDWPPAAAGSSR